VTLALGLRNAAAPQLKSLAARLHRRWDLGAMRWVPGASSDLAGIRTRRDAWHRLNAQRPQDLYLGRVNSDLVVMVACRRSQRPDV